MDVMLTGEDQSQADQLNSLDEGAEITLHTILPVVGGTIHTAPLGSLDQFRKLGIDPQRAIKLVQKLHAHPVQYAQNLTSTRHAIEIKNAQQNSGALGLQASRNPPDPH
eukprot:663649-Pelagomonas_calceolata.AAC.1